MTNEERAMELYNALKRCCFNVEIIMCISTHDDEIRRECAERVRRLAHLLTLVEDDISDAYTPGLVRSELALSTIDPDEIRRECNDEVYRKMLSAELTKDHDRQIRNECAGSAVNDWFLNAQIDHNEETLRAAIMGKETTK